MGDSGPPPLAGPKAAFETYQRNLLSGLLGLDPDLLADDVVIEFPFAPEGRPRRFAGRQAFGAYAGPERAAFQALQVRFDEFRNVTVHETSDPEVIVAEYELRGTLSALGRQTGASFVSVIRVRDGRIVGWREYQDTLAMTAALGPSGQESEGK